MMPIAEQDDRADQALARPRARLLHGFGRLEPALVAGGIALLLEHGGRRSSRTRGWRAGGADRIRSGGVAAGTLRQSVLEHAAHGVEGAEDDDSISGVGARLERCGERLARARVRRHASTAPAAAARACRESLGELRRASPRARRQVGEMPGVDERRHAREDRRRCPCRASRRTPRACAGRSPSRRGCAPARARPAGCARRRARSPAAPGSTWKRPGSSTVASPVRTACALDRQPLAQRLERGQRGRRVEQLVGAAQRRIAEAAEARARGRVQLPLLAIAGVAEVAAGAAAGRRRSRAASSSTLRGGSDRRRSPACRRARCRPSRARSPRGRRRGIDVVDVDARDHGAVGVDDIDRVEPPAEADLEDHQRRAASPRAATRSRAA